MTAGHSALGEGAATGPAPAPALEVAGLHAGYGAVTVLRDVSITVPSGSVTALIGPNGAGKSTLLRTIAGLVAPTEGSVRLWGEDVTRHRTTQRARRGLCLIPEGRAVYRSLTVKENLTLQARPGAAPMAIEQACSIFPVLGRRLEQRASTLSGGEQQMLALSAAYVRDPKLVLVDEASQGLAPIVVDAIFEFLKQVAERDAALLIVDQYVTKALGMADYAYVLRQGAIGFAGSPQELLQGDVFEHYVGTG